MKAGLWPYFLKQALTNISNNRTIHIIGLGTMVVSTLIFGAFLLLYLNVDRWVQGWRHPLTMSVYLADTIDKAAREQVIAFIKNLPGAQIKKFISKEEALIELKKALGPQAHLLDGIPGNPLPASLEIIFEDTKSKKLSPQDIKKQIQEINGVEDVQYSEEWLDRFGGVMNMVRLVGLILGGLLGLGILFIVTNTIKLAIYTRKEEIEILKLVGATDWFIRIPFLLEGIIQGFFSGILTLFILFLGYLVVSAQRMYFLRLSMLSFDFLPFEYSVYLLVTSVILGMAGSFIAIGRFFEI